MALISIFSSRAPSVPDHPGRDHEAKDAICAVWSGTRHLILVWTLSNGTLKALDQNRKEEFSSLC